jgi:hypothetical protein
MVGEKRGVEREGGHDSGLSIGSYACVICPFLRYQI